MASKLSLLNKSQALFLPKGSIRAILALIIIAPVAIISLKSGVEFTGDQVIGIASLILTAYFVKAAGESAPNRSGE